MRTSRPRSSWGHRSTKSSARGSREARGCGRHAWCSSSGHTRGSCRQAGGDTRGSRGDARGGKSARRSSGGRGEAGRCCCGGGEGAWCGEGAGGSCCRVACGSCGHGSWRWGIAWQGHHARGQARRRVYRGLSISTSHCLLCRGGAGGGWSGSGCWQGRCAHSAWGCDGWLACWHPFN